MKNWVDDEMDEIIKEKIMGNKKVKHKDEVKFFLLIIFCAFSFFMMNISQASASEKIQDYIGYNDGTTWVCSGCGNRCWSNSTDWKGQYHCNACGKIKR